MVDAVRAWLAEQRIKPANFYYEKFSASGSRVDQQSGSNGVGHP
jgi:hypothetical protein